MKRYQILALLALAMLPSIASAATMPMLSSTSTVEAPIPSKPELSVSLTEIEVMRRVDTIKIKETGKRVNCANVRGGSGEIGCWQILPSTFDGLKKKHKIQVKGYSYEAQKAVVLAEIRLDLKNGLTVAQTMKKWNSDNLWPCSRGINRWGVRYDSCKYVKEGLKIYEGL